MRLLGFSLVGNIVSFFSVTHSILKILDAELSGVVKIFRNGNWERFGIGSVKRSSVLNKKRKKGRRCSSNLSLSRRLVSPIFCLLYLWYSESCRYGF